MLNATLVPPDPQDSAQVAGGSTTTPAANATLAQVVPTVAGMYEVDISWCLTGTAETALTNLKITYNGADRVTGLPSISATNWVSLRLYVKANGSNGIALKATALATTGAIYNAIVVARRIG